MLPWREAYNNIAVGLPVGDLFRVDSFSTRARGTNDLPRVTFFLTIATVFLVSFPARTVTSVQPKLHTAW